MNFKTGITFVALMAAGTMATAFAQGPGADIYKTKCQICHGASGLADSGPGKVMKVKPISDPAVKKMTESQMIEAVRIGMGRMQPYKDKLTEAQIKETVSYYRSLSK
jgi:mono/diheme cytochrome c family protein